MSIFDSGGQRLPRTVLGPPTHEGVDPLLASGYRLSTYEIVGLIGSGGMGDVYEARDLKLDRRVAIKVLRADLASDRRRLNQFEQEARAASSLDHPNIVTIHDICRSKGHHFIVMQYVPGNTLEDLMSRGSLTLKKALDYAIQIAGALSQAHCRGIVHRDLKPGNIMVTGDGQVKILDFGLAKLLEAGVGSDVATRGCEPTHETRGHIMGTAAYMSPEQIEGGDVDHRSDVFSFGSVLYEMVAQRPAFSGNSAITILTKIREGQVPDIGGVVPNVPYELERVIGRALRLEPERRFQSLADACVELQEVRDLLDTGNWVSVADLLHRDRPRRRLSRFLLPALLLLFGLVAIHLSGFLREPPVEPVRRIVPLTTFPGWEREPALSPDGRFVAFSWDDGGGVSRLYVLLLGAHEPLLVTSGQGDARNPAWSPDGSQIAFLRHTAEGEHDVLAVPALGGPERWLARLSDVHFRGLDWSPDGSSLAVVDRAVPQSNGSIFRLSIETGEKRQMTTALSSGLGDRTPAFSPDGNFLAFVRWREAPVTEIHLIELSKTDSYCLTTHDGYIRDLDWLPDSSGLVFSSRSKGTTGLWRIPLVGEGPTPLPVGEGATGVTLAAEADRLVYSRMFTDANIWRIGGPEARTELPAEKIIGSTRDDFSPSFSPDGKHIAFTSERSGKRRIWICDSEGESCSQLRSGVTASMAAWSPQGERIAFSGGEEGKSAVYVADLKGEYARRLSEEDSINIVSGWSRDGQSIYLASDRTGEYQIWKIPASGGPARQITQGGGIFAQESHDGRFLYYLKLENPRTVWRLNLADGKESPIFETRMIPASLEVWHDKVFWVPDRSDRQLSIEQYGIISHQRGRLLAPTAGVLVAKYGRLSVSPDGKWILYPREDGGGSDLMLVEGFDGPSGSGLGDWMR